jgi:serine/threonine-protein kinase
MGEVYRARDTKLKREVAIKILPDEFSRDPARVGRFQREAEVLASLNHPNIAAIYDLQEADGVQFLVLELVEGETLADRIALGQIPVEEALSIAKSISEALEAAHERGIIHRDLKPANVKVTPEGKVKVLDFGLAKAMDNAPASATLSNSPTMLSGTMGGIILGTAGYMSPEQARGKPVDKRTDIWSWGVVLYELLTGERMFKGDDAADTLAQVLTSEPDLARVPARVQPLLRRCLVKDPKHRLRDIGDAMPLFDGVPEPAPERRPWVWIAVAATLAIAFAVTSVLLYRLYRDTRSPPPHPIVRLSAEVGPDITMERFGGSLLAVSPDGTRLAVVVRGADAKNRLATRQLDQSQVTPLSGTEGAYSPFFSPDGQWIGFFAGGKLKKVPVQGGATVTLWDASPARSSASWGSDDNIVAALNADGVLSRIPSAGGAARPLTALDKQRGEFAHRFPQVLPGGEAVLFTALASGNYDDANIDALSFKTGERKTVHRGGYFGRYLPSGHLVYLRQNTLFAAPFDLSRLTETGAPQPVLEDVSIVLGGGDFDFSQTGTFVYLSGKWGQQAIFWLDSTGKTQPLNPAPGYYWNQRFSPDGKRLAFVVSDSLGGFRDVWVQDLERDTTSRLTFLPGTNNAPIWTPDGKSVIFESWYSAAPGLYWIRADRVGEAQRLTDGLTPQFPNSFSPDGKRLAYYQQSTDGYYEIWTAPVEGDSDHPRLGKAEPFLRTPFHNVTQPTFSADGRWLAYSSDETGRQEVYVQPFPGPGEKWQISTGGGTFPMWARNGRELFFLVLDGRIISRIMVAGYTTRGDSFVVGRPQIWSQKHLLYVGNPLYDLAPDGKRFAVILYADGTAEAPITHLTFLLNFFDELKRRVPVGK